ncbi:MAG: hypothetical protein FJY54_16585 [Betaproteobacteria bacterium]|nr:hypothetical protein [Betaproteobacteria bacterium]
MTPRRIRKVIALLGLVAWLPFVLALYPMPHQTAAQIEHEMRQTEKELGPLAKRVSPKPLEQQIDDVKRERWLLWFVNLSLLALGLIGSGMSFKGIGVWRGLMLTLSVLFLAFYLLDYASGPHASVGEFVSWKLKMIQGFREEGRIGSYAFFGLKEFILPVVHLIILSLLVYYCYWSQAKGEQAVPR